MSGQKLTVTCNHSYFIFSSVFTLVLFRLWWIWCLATCCRWPFCKTSTSQFEMATFQSTSRMLNFYIRSWPQTIHTWPFTSSFTFYNTDSLFELVFCYLWGILKSTVVCIVAEIFFFLGQRSIQDAHTKEYQELAWSSSVQKDPGMAYCVCSRGRYKEIQQLFGPQVFHLW